MYEKSEIATIEKCRIENIDVLKKKYNIRKITKLDANENPNCMKISKLKMKNILNLINYYPDNDCTNLRSKLSQSLRIPENYFLFGNGSSEIISLIIKAFINKGEKVITPVPTFTPYIIESKIAGAKVEKVELTQNYKIDLEKIIEKIDNSTKLIVLINPHNPTGTLIEKDEFYNFMKKVPANVLVLLDEAYIEYVDENKKIDAKKSIDNYENLFILRTFSKAYGLAGIRVGYLIANPKIIESVEKVKPSVNLSCVSEFLAIQALQNKKYLEKTISINNIAREKFYKALDELKIFYIDSYTNFVMIRPNENADVLYQKLLNEGIVVNHNFHNMEDFLRITIGNKKQMNTVIKCIKNSVKGDL
jgi:histidinol-phosphate aminotransferase